MEYRKLANTGLKVSLVGIGCNNFGRRCDAFATAAVVDAAIDTGVNFFDSADIYGPNGLSEEYLGQAIKGKDRSSIIIASKFANPMGEGDLQRGASRRYIMNAVDASLKRLGTDYIDLYQQHVPDNETPIEETLRALDDLVSGGKVRYIGHSNFSGWQLADADWTAKHHGLHRFVTAQNHYSLIDRRLEKDVIPAAQQFGIGILPYFPLASGLLTGKYTRGEAPPQGTRLAAWGERGAAALSEQNFAIVDKLKAFAEARGHTLLELAMSWLASKPYISSVIAGATSAAQVEQNAAAIAWRLTDEEMTTVNELSAR
jgi:aryl-alcohol dehydrogenase-like predicted oxidoreductase